MRYTERTFKLLVEAHAIVDGIPKRIFDLEKVVQRPGFFAAKQRIGQPCGTLACGIGWLAFHPEFSKKIGLSMDPVSGDLRRRDGSAIEWLYKDVAEAFEISHLDATNIFSTRGQSDYDAELEGAAKPKVLSDKKLFLKRIRVFLAEHERL